MRNRWFPARVADYVPKKQLKQLKADGVDMSRDFNFGVQSGLEEFDDAEAAREQAKPYVRPIEIEMLSVCLVHDSLQAQLLTVPA